MPYYGEGYNDGYDEGYNDGYGAASRISAHERNGLVACIAELEAALARRDALLQVAVGACMGHLAVEKLEACIKAELSK